MDPFRIVIRCVFSFVFLLFLVRVSGKRVVHEASAFDFVLTLIMGDLVDDAFFGEVPVANFIVAAATLVLIEIVVTILVHKNKKLLWLIEGRPALIMENGSLKHDAMKREKLNEDEVSALLRLVGIEKEKWHQARIAAIEAIGEPSLLKHNQMQDAKKYQKSALKKRI